MGNRSKSRRRAALYAASSKARKRSNAIIPKGRLDHGPPIAVIDIGSNSIRLVIYEGLTRAPTPIFNEKVLAGLGRQVQSTGLLPADAIEVYRGPAQNSDFLLKYVTVKSYDG